MKTVRTIATAAAFVIAAAIPALAANSHGVSAIPTIGSGGKIVADGGMTLYFYGKDPNGKSTCYGKCAKIWPPLLGNAATFHVARAPRGKINPEFTLVHRKNGSEQWAYQGKPLYLYSKDTQKGEASGNGVKGVWHVAKATTQ